MDLFEILQAERNNNFTERCTLLAILKRLGPTPQKPLHLTEKELEWAKTNERKLKDEKLAYGMVFRPGKKDDGVEICIVERKTGKKTSAEIAKWQRAND